MTRPPRKEQPDPWEGLRLSKHATSSTKRASKPEDTDLEDAPLSAARTEKIDKSLDPVPKKGGRGPGSGAREKRKDGGQYSTNINTVRSIKRRAALTPDEGELDRVKRNLISALSKARKKVRLEPGFDRLPKAVQDQKIAAAEESVKKRRAELGYTEDAVREAQQARRDALKAPLPRGNGWTTIN